MGEQLLVWVGVMRAAKLIVKNFPSGPERAGSTSLELL